jgi:uncharacterized membrane protein
MSAPPPPRLRDYTSIPFEIFIAVFTILPFFLLAYFYSVLPDRVPLFMHLNGEVAEWGQKSLISVFRVPLMALIIQIVCLLMKYGTIQSSSAAHIELDLEQARVREQSLSLNASLWDWFRWAGAFKMIAESINTIFLSFDLRFFSRLTFIVTAIAALVGAAGALYYCYRLLVVSRQLKQKFGNTKPGKPIDGGHVYGGIVYFNPSDSALFSGRYIFNFANIWAWVFIACVIAYPLLVLCPG